MEIGGTIKHPHPRSAPRARAHNQVRYAIVVDIGHGGGHAPLEAGTKRRKGGDCRVIKAVVNGNLRGSAWAFSGCINGHVGYRRDQRHHATVFVGKEMTVIDKGTGKLDWLVAENDTTGSNDIAGDIQNRWGNVHHILIPGLGRGNIG